MTSLTAKEQRLADLLRACGSVVIGFSGGVDSTLLLRLAIDTLGSERVLAVVADTPSLPRRELDEALRLARELGAECQTINPGELDDPCYAENPPDRCYYCKHHIFEQISSVARNRGFAQVIDGSNADDIGDYRPGLRAVRELGVRSPLQEAGLTKCEIRSISQRLGLPTATKPAMACLSSRVPYGTAVTRELLGRIEQAEAALHAAGFAACRVRHHDTVARIEVEPAEMPRLLDTSVREKLVAAIKSAGYRYVTLDLQGYRTGSLNEGVAPAKARHTQSGAAQD